MKKSLTYIAALSLIVLTIIIDFSKGSSPIEQTNAFDTASYELVLTEDVLVNSTLIGLEGTPNRSIEFTSLDNGNIQIAINYDPALDEQLMAEGLSEVSEPETFIYEITEIVQVSDTQIDLINEEEGLWFAFETDDSGFVYDQIGFGYMIIPNE